MTVRGICANTQKEIKSRTSSVQFSYSNFGIRVLALCGCNSFNFMPQNTKKYPIKISERKAG